MKRSTIVGWALVGAIVLIVIAPAGVLLLLAIASLISGTGYLFYKMQHPEPKRAPPPLEDFGPTLAEIIDSKSESAQKGSPSIKAATRESTALAPTATPEARLTPALLRQKSPKPALPERRLSIGINAAWEAANSDSADSVETPRPPTPVVVVGSSSSWTGDIKRAIEPVDSGNAELRAARIGEPPGPPTPAVVVGSTSSWTGDIRRAIEPLDSGDAELRAVTIGATSGASHQAFSTPKAPPGFGNGRWISRTEEIEVAGTLLRGGLFYVGTSLTAPNGRTDPCLISPKLEVSSRGRFTDREMGYWPSYSEIAPPARRAYLTWLSEGRAHPSCDIGYVFLFFYGLERRVFVDSQLDPNSKLDWPDISDELQRLLPIYGANNSFRRYAGELMDWIALDTSARLYDKPIPVFERTSELPRYIRLALGQTALAREPVPASLALSWVRLDPGIALRTPATRCAEEFGQLFVSRYKEILGAGLLLPHNRTKLKFVYQPASSGLRGAATLTKTFGDTPDVTALMAPLKTLQAIVDQCVEELASFSRMLGKDPDARASLDGLLQLPASLWPAETRSGLHAFLSGMEAGMFGTTLSHIFAVLRGSGASSDRERTKALARALEALGIGMEPAVLTGARIPDAADPIVLFSIEPTDSETKLSVPYQVAILTLQLASAVALADGSFNASELARLRHEVQNWIHLTPANQRRLQAHLQLLSRAPVTLGSLNKKLMPLDANAKKSIAAFMASLAQADGVISPQEVRFLEKVYKALGIDPKQVFSDIHASETSAPTTGATPRVGFTLNAKRIAELQLDTAKVSALLSGIFNETEPSPPPSPPVDDPMETIPAPGMLGLDQAHSALARLMLTRPHWSRSDLEDATNDLELMLDGALEHINDAAFDAFDLPFSIGEDPVEVNSEMIERLEL